MINKTYLYINFFLSHDLLKQNEKVLTIYTLIISYIMFIERYDGYYSTIIFRSKNYNIHF